MTGNKIASFIRSCGSGRISPQGKKSESGRSRSSKALAVGLSMVLALGENFAPDLAFRAEMRELLNSVPQPVALQEVVNHQDPTYHVVEQGETWQDVAYQFGIPMDVLKAANPNFDFSQGKKLLIPDPVPGKWRHVNPPGAYIGKIIGEVAKSKNVPEETLKAVAWNESRWQQWQENGEVTHHHDPARRNSPASDDWGIAQINDHAHPDAFPSAKLNLKYNLQVAALILRGDYEEGKSWTKALALYNGSNSYPRKIFVVEKRQPWARLEDEIRLVDVEEEDDEKATA